jgi:phage FluMu protein gp41
VTVHLEKGLTIGGVTHTEAVIRETTAGDIIDASEESERLFPTPEGYELVQSPSQTAMNTLRRQIVSIGEIEGPLELAVLKKLSGDDLAEIQIKAQTLDAVALEAASRGRDHEGGEAGD